MNYPLKSFDFIKMICQNCGMLPLVVSIELGNIVHLHIILDAVSKAGLMSPNSNYIFYHRKESYTRCPAGLYPLYSPLSKSLLL